MHAGANETMQFPGRSSLQQGPRVSFVAGAEGAMRRLLCAQLTNRSKIMQLLFTLHRLALLDAALIDNIPSSL